jgi:hypothetical protein
MNNMKELKRAAELARAEEGKTTPPKEAAPQTLTVYTNHNGVGGMYDVDTQGASLQPIADQKGAFNGAGTSNTNSTDHDESSPSSSTDLDNSDVVGTSNTNPIDLDESSPSSSTDLDEGTSDNPSDLCGFYVPETPRRGKERM